MLERRLARARLLAPRLARPAVGVAAGLAVAFAACGVGFGPVVRARVGAEAARRHLVVDIGSVRPGWFAVHLRDVRVGAVEAPGVHVQIEDLAVEVGALLGIREIVGRGGRVELQGSLEELGDELRRWRGDRPSEEASARTLVPVRVEALSVEWRIAEGAAPSVVASGVSVARDGGGARLSVESGVFRDGEHQASVRGGALAIGAGVLRSASAGEVTLVREAPDVAEDAKASSVASEPAPPPLPAAAARAGIERADSKAVEAAPLVELPRMAGVRQKVAVLASLVKGRVADGASVAIDSLAFEVRGAEGKVTIGPGPLSVARRGDELEVTFTTRAEAGGAPLALKAEVPLERGELVLSLAGGPVPIGLLGASEGTVGLVDVGRSTLGGKGRVVLSAEGSTLTFDGEVEARGVAVKHPRLAGDVVRGIDVSVRGRGMLDDAGELRVDELDAALGAIRVSAHGAIEQRPDHYAATLAFVVPSAPCASLLDSLPSALVPSLRGARMDGLFGAQGRVAVDSRKLDDLVLVYDVEDHCKVVEVPPSLAKARFTEPFDHTIYLPDGRLTQETTGPGTDGWTDLDHISPFMQVAVLTTEDGAFLHHHGFNHGAIRGAVIANLKARRFVRGASTITMQLAKNLFLTREKTVARKLEELILTDYLEQAFTKEEMMELYLNIIEFGPNVYGVTAAAQHYFGRKPAELNLAECLFLASVLPSPTRYHRLFEKGQISDAWLKHVRDLMVIAEKTGKISAGELAEGLSQSIVFHDEKLPPPPPRAPVTSSHFLGDDPPDWQELN